MGGHAGGTGELGIAVHAAHAVGKAVAGRASAHVVRVQGAAGAAAGGNTEILVAGFVGPLLISAGHQMLEAGGVGAVAGDGHLHALLLHNGNAFQHVVCAVAVYGGALASGERLFALDDQLAGLKVVIGLYISKAVDAADDVGGVFAQAVEVDPQRLVARFVGSFGNADGAFRGGKALVGG